MGSGWKYDFYIWQKNVDINTNCELLEQWSIHQGQYTNVSPTIDNVSHLTGANM